MSRHRDWTWLGILVVAGAGCGNLPTPKRDAGPESAPYEARAADAAPEVGGASDTSPLDAPFDRDHPAAIDLPIESANADAPPASVSRIYACGELLADSANLLRRWLDPWTGLPYDNMPCGGGGADGGAANRVNPAFGVIPQLASGAQAAFSEDGSRTSGTVAWSFEDTDPDGHSPSLLFALEIALHLDAGGEAGAPNRFGGITWGANADINRYSQVKLRYRTSSASAAWQLKLNSGTNRLTEPVVSLPGSATWTDAVFDIAQVFPGTDRQHLNYLTFAGALVDGDVAPVLWIDQVSFLAEPSRLGDCAVTCAEPLPAYPDLACYEPQTGVVNVANALTFFSAAPAVALVDSASAEASVATMLDSLERLPGAMPALRANGQPYVGGSWFQDWHSPVSLMPSPRNRIASLTDQPQLYAALMVVEQAWPRLAARAAALRARLDFSVLYDERGGCPGKLQPGIDRCTGPVSKWTIGGFGTDYLLGSFLATASGAAPPCFWTTGLSPDGCTRSGPASAPWYSTGVACQNAAIPGTENGGPFMQLAGLLYLASEDIPMGMLPLADSARNMMRAQYRYANTLGVPLAGWANATDPDSCGYLTCSSFTPEKVTPYISAMAAGDDFPEAYDMLRAFRLFGADASLDTGDTGVALGLRDGWNQASASTGDSYLYLDTGWSVLGLLNACHDELVRQRFATHPVAQAGYAIVKAGAPPCP